MVTNPNKVNLFLCMALMWALVLTGCSGSGAGNAPGGTSPVTNTPSVVPPNQSTLNTIKNGILIQTSNGWNLQMDTSDPIKPLTTANGWKIEVKYE